MATIKMSYGRDERLPANFGPDHDWFRANEADLLEKYGECSVLVYHQQVIGVGESMRDAVADAERRLGSETGVVTPLHEYLTKQNPFLRALPGDFKTPQREDKS